MKFIRITNAVIDFGVQAFDDYTRYAISGSGDHEGLTRKRERNWGIATLPGAIVACLDHGIRDTNALICAVSRISTCKRTTVATFLREVVGLDDLDTFLGEDAARVIEHNLLSGTTLLVA